MPITFCVPTKIIHIKSFRNFIRGTPLAWKTWKNNHGLSVIIFVYSENLKYQVYKSPITCIFPVDGKTGGPFCTLPCFRCGRAAGESLGGGAGRKDPPLIGPREPGRTRSTAPSCRILSCSPEHWPLPRRKCSRVCRKKPLTLYNSRIVSIDRGNFFFCGCCSCQRQEMF